MIHASFKIIELLVLEKVIFKDFNHIWACDLDDLYKLSSPIPNK